MSLAIGVLGYGLGSALHKKDADTKADSARGAKPDANPLEDLLIQTGRGGAMLNPSKKEIAAKSSHLYGQTS